ncbi:hypothetical protein MTO96_049528 [Rhipicephalus appendiculatus]
MGRGDRGATSSSRSCLPTCTWPRSAAPRWMKNREPYKLRHAILTYNVATALVNAYFCYRYARITYFGGGYSFFCQGINKDVGSPWR